MPFAETANLTYAQAETAYRDGRLSQEDWEAYCRAWRNSAVRFSSLAQEYEEPARAGER